MTYTLFSTAGCARCKILKGRMAELGIAYEEHDFKAEGKAAFQQFYTAHRSQVYRGADGIEFPILTDGTVIRQGVGQALAHLEGGEALSGYFHIGVLHKEWLDGIDLSGGDPAQNDKALAVLRYLKKNAMKLVVETNGSNFALLDAVLKEGLATKIVVKALGPLSLYSQLAGREVDPEDIKKSMAAVVQGSDYQFQTAIAPVRRADGTLSHLTPAEITETAKLIAEATGSKKQPYLLKLAQNSASADPEIKALPPLEASALLPYRSAARAFQVAVEIEK